MTFESEGLLIAADPGRAKIGHGGSPSSKNFFFRPDGYSNKPNA